MKGVRFATGISLDQHSVQWAGHLVQNSVSKSSHCESLFLILDFSMHLPDFLSLGNIFFLPHTPLLDLPFWNLFCECLLVSPI
jgi:hypothetical protein